VRRRKSIAAVAALIAYIQKQNGMTTDEILAQAGVTLDENEKMLLEDKIPLRRMNRARDPQPKCSRATRVAQERSSIQVAGKCF